MHMVAIFVMKKKITGKHTSVLAKYEFHEARSDSWPPMSHMTKCVLLQTISSTLLPMVGDVWTASLIRLEKCK